MLHYLLMLLAALLLIANPVLESITAAGPLIDYLVAISVAVLLMPWLSDQFD